MNDGRDETSGRGSAAADIRVGRRLRALRMERNLSLAQVAAKAGISIGALSQIERGRSSLRVRVVWPLAAALEVEPSALIADDGDTASDVYCVRAARRRRLPVQSEGIAKELLSPPGATLMGLLVTVAPGGGTPAYTHAGHEFAIVTSGELEIVIDSSAYRLRAGDSVAFRSTMPHAFRNPGAEPCTVLWVNTQKPRDGANA